MRPQLEVRGRSLGEDGERPATPIREREAVSWFGCDGFNKHFSGVSGVSHHPLQVEWMNE